MARIHINGHDYVTARAVDRVLDVLHELAEYMDQRADADHDAVGYVGNEEMRLLVDIQNAIAEVS